MTNLFTIFDPSTPYFLSSNWSSVFMIMLLLPSFLWVLPVRMNQIFFSIFAYLNMGFKPLNPKMLWSFLSPITFFIIIMLSNTLGLLPYIFTSTSQLTVTVSLALPIWLAMVMYGWLNNTSNLLAHLIPQGTPTVLMPFMVMIETISNLIRPLTLAVRLTANMVAGHLLLVLLSSANPAPMPITPIIFVSNLALMALELAVAFIQAYVFSVLVTLYVAEFAN